jgi:hypothetical protein
MKGEGLWLYKYGGILHFVFYDQKDVFEHLSLGASAKDLSRPSAGGSRCNKEFCTILLDMTGRKGGTEPEEQAHCTFRVFHWYFPSGKDLPLPLFLTHCPSVELSLLNFNLKMKPVAALEKLSTIPFVWTCLTISRASLYQNAL